MSFILVNPPLFWKLGDARISYLDVCQKIGEDPKGLRSLPAEHLGLRSIQAYCAKQGIPVHVVNGIVAEHTGVEPTFAEIEAIVREHGEPALVGFSGTSHVFQATLRLARMCLERWPNAHTVMGYDFGTLNFEQLLRDYPDIHFVCRGDGEAVFAALAERLANGRGYDDIPGLAYRGSDGRVHASEPVALDIDTLPWPTRDELPQVLRGGFAAGIYASRGCPYRCSYCALGQTSALFGNKSYRLRSIESVVEEMAYLAKEFGVHHITIVDDLFLTKAASSQERARDFAEQLLRRNLGLEWMIDARVDSIDRELFTLLRHAGLRKVFVGVETGSEEQLASYNKRYGLNEETQVDRLKVLRDLEITIVPGMLMFHPNVTARELRQSLELIDEMGSESHYQLYNRVQVYPGTPLYREYEEKGWATGEWPVKDWEFRDPRAKRLSDAVLWASMQSGAKFQDVKNVFLHHLEAWENDLEITEPSPPSIFDSAALQRSGAA
jgi:radical SAM superfamily enzyme YgiQ (UPF0313 family)